MGFGFCCDIVSAEQEVFHGRVELLVAHCESGDVGIMYGHSPLLGRLKPGPVRCITPEGVEHIFFVSGGFLEVQPDAVAVLADTVQRAADLDEAAAREARRAATEHMKGCTPGTVECARAEALLAEAIARLRTLDLLRKTLGHRA